MINIAFAGHIRDSDLVDTEVCAARITDAMLLLKKAGTDRGRLLVGAADGADTIAITAWMQAGMGPVHVVHPFMDGYHPEQGESATWLDGERAEAAGGNAHLDQTRWLLAYADLIIVLWNGSAPRGAGGTADIVMLGLARGAPILWISTDPNDIPIRLLPSSYADSDVLELRAAVQVIAEAPAAEAAALAARVSARAPPPQGGAETLIDRVLARSLWRTFAVFRGVLGSAKAGAAEPPPPPDLKEQPGFAMLSRLADETSERAARLSDIHRSAQVLLLMVALAATVAGASPAVFPAAKLWSSLAELGLLLTGLTILLAAGRSRRHEHWAQLRCEAEHLRSHRVAWVLGMSPIERSDDFIPSGVAPPTGAYDGRRLNAWGRWALGQLIEGQDAYHAEQAAVGHRISERVKVLETATFAGLLVSLAIFGLVHLLHRESRLPGPLTSLMILVGAIGPAIGAACMTLEARFGFEEQRGRSLDLSHRFHQLAKRIPQNGTLSELQSIAQVAMQLTAREAQAWRYGAERRRLSRGG